jgi:hypothetical protein
MFLRSGRKLNKTRMATRRATPAAPDFGYRVVQCCPEMPATVDCMDFLTDKNAEGWLVRRAGQEPGEELWQPVLARSLALPSLDHRRPREPGCGQGRNRQ